VVICNIATADSKKRQFIYYLRHHKEVKVI